MKKVAYILASIILAMPWSAFAQVEATPQLDQTNWGPLENNEYPGVMHEYSQSGWGYNETSPTPIFDFNPETNPGGMDQLDLALSGCTLQFSYIGDGLDAVGDDWVAEAGSVAENLDVSGVASLSEVETPTHGTADIAVDFSGAGVFDAPTTATGDPGSGDFVSEILVFSSTSSTDDYAGTSNGNNNGWAWRHTVGGAVSFRINDGTDTLTVNGGTSVAASSWSYSIFFGDRDGNAETFTNGTSNGTSAMSSVAGDLGEVATFNIGSNGGNGLQTDGYVAMVRFWTCTDVSTLTYADVSAERWAKLTGTYVDGTQSFTRATSATLMKDVGGSVYQAFNVADGWPRVVDHPAQGSGFQSELAATNIMLQNYDLGTTWSLIDAGDTIGGTVDDLFGVSRSTLGIIGDATDGQHGVSQAATVTAAAWTYSCVAEPGDQDWLYMANTTVANATHYCNVSTCANGTTGAGATALDPYDFGTKCRCAFTFTGTAASHTFQVSPAAADGDNTFAGDGATVNLYAEHCQLELRAAPTSIIPTLTTSVTRDGDVLAYTPGASTTRGSLIVDYTSVKRVANVTTRAALALGTASVGFIIQNQSGVDDRPRFFVSDTSTQADITGTGDMFDGARHTISGTYDTNSFILYYDGVSVGTPDTSGTVPSTNDDFEVGHFAAGLQLGGVIHKAQTYNVEVKE